MPPPPIPITHALEIPPLPSSTPARTPVPTPPAKRVDKALEQLVRGRLGADAAHFAVVIENLTDGRPVVAFLPDGTLVEHKTANWDNATHDAGIVHRKKETYVIVLMSDLDSGAARVEADVAQIAFDYFER